MRRLCRRAQDQGGTESIASYVLMMTKADASQGKSPSELITERIRELGDWRGATLAHVRKLIKEAAPEVVEEWKWRGVPVWSDGAIICTGESYKTHVKLTFLKGASLQDPEGVFNASLDGNARRAIDLFEGDKMNDGAFQEIIRAAVELNAAKKKKK
jgi:hypothetical protein